MICHRLVHEELNVESLLLSQPCHNRRVHHKFCNRLARLLAETRMEPLNICPVVTVSEDRHSAPHVCERSLCALHLI